MSQPATIVGPSVLGRLLHLEYWENLSKASRAYRFQVPEKKILFVNGSSKAGERERERGGGGKKKTCKKQATITFPFSTVCGINNARD